MAVEKEGKVVHGSDLALVGRLIKDKFVQSANIDPAPVTGSSNPVASGGVADAIAAKDDKPVIIRANQQKNMAGDITLTSPTSGIEAYSIARDALAVGKDVILAITQTNTGRERLYRAWAWKSSANDINFQADITGSKISFSFRPDGQIVNQSAGGFYEQTSRKVTSISSSSTDTEYPSAKAVYDAVSAATMPSLSNSEIDDIWDSAT